MFIPDLDLDKVDFYPSLIPDPGVKKAPDPGSSSLLKCKLTSFFLLSALLIGVAALFVAVLPLSCCLCFLLAEKAPTALSHSWDRSSPLLKKPSKAKAAGVEAKGTANQRITAKSVGKPSSVEKEGTNTDSTIPEIDSSSAVAEMTGTAEGQEDKAIGEVGDNKATVAAMENGIYGKKANPFPSSRDGTQEIGSAVGIDAAVKTMQYHHWSAESPMENGPPAMQMDGKSANDSWPVESHMESTEMNENYDDVNEIVENGWSSEAQANDTAWETKGDYYGAAAEDMGNNPWSVVSQKKEDSGAIENSSSSMVVEASKHGSFEQLNRAAVKKKKNRRDRE
jgi:hypothetical protein